MNVLVGRRFGLIPCHNAHATKDRMRNNVSKPLDRACPGRLLSERNMRSHLIIVGGVFRKDSSKVLRVEPDQMVSTRAGPTQSSVQPILSAKVSGTRSAGPGCP